MERRPKLEAAKYRRLIKTAHKQLSLSGTYLEDGAPTDAARCAVEAASTLFKLSMMRLSV